MRVASISVPNYKWTHRIYIAGNSNTTNTNLAIQGAYVGLRVASGDNNTIKNCQIEHGLHRILMQGDPGSTITPSSNLTNNATSMLVGYQ
jgi:Right handed beta helix region